ncbi:MAG: hypothetical protein E6J13_03645 [Chloroflexi bacterium]|nr:MAG: hypothetical protein E6J13_03645 [Chloroflexota bacterium]
MTVLRCERLATGDVDAAMASLGFVTLARTPVGAFAEVDADVVDRARRALAFAGVRATVSLETLAPRPGTRAAIGRDLVPLPLGSVALDLVHLRSLPLGPETARLLRTTPLRRPNVTRRALIRDLLSGADVSVGWRRRAWTTREVLRSAEVRRVLRPVVFDIAAISSPPERRALTREGRVARWLFG